jgi:hypothetical protein
MTEGNNISNEMNVLDNNNGNKIEDDSDADNSNGPQLDFEEAMQIFCTGFGQCAREAIRYLIEDEGLAANDPIVVGLKQHLVLQETYFLLQSLNYQRNDILPSYEDVMSLRSQDSGYASASSLESSRPISPSNSLNDKLLEN